MAACLVIRRPARTAVVTLFRKERLPMPPAAPSALDLSVLVLNKMFLAVHVVSVRPAFCLLCKDLAEVVAVEDGQYASYDFTSWREVSAFRAQFDRVEDDDWVRTAKADIQVPRVIRLYAYDKVPKQVVK